MRRHRILTLFLALVVAGAVSGTQATTAGASVMLNVGVHLGDPPPPPAYVFDDEPEVILVPSTRVYYVPETDFDLYRYGRYWYINRAGWICRCHHSYRRGINHRHRTAFNTTKRDYFCASQVFAR